jgi:septum formation protein
VNATPAWNRIILASASPRRREILTNAGYIFETADPGDVEESVVECPTPEILAMEKAKAKAQAVAGRLTPPFPALVVGTDTLCVLGNQVIGKPLDRADARAILSRLSGTRHRVISGMCLWPITERTEVKGLRTELRMSARSLSPQSSVLSPYREAGIQLISATTWVTLRKMSRAEIDNYVDSGESDGKAGAYAIQEKGDRFVTSVEGSFLNVVGFPLEAFREALATAGLRLKD